MSLNFCEVLLIKVAVSLRYYFLLDELLKYKSFNSRSMPDAGLAETFCFSKCYNLAICATLLQSKKEFLGVVSGVGFF